VKALQWVAMTLIVACAMLVDVDVPIGPDPRYNVVSVQDGLTLYLSFSGAKQQYKVIWSVLESDAWPYSSRVTAQADIDRYGGTLVPMRGE